MELKKKVSKKTPRGQAPKRLSCGFFSGLTSDKQAPIQQSHVYQQSQRSDMADMEESDPSGTLDLSHLGFKGQNQHLNLDLEANWKAVQLIYTFITAVSCPNANSYTVYLAEASAPSSRVAPQRTRYSSQALDVNKATISTIAESTTYAPLSFSEKEQDKKPSLRELRVPYLRLITMSVAEATFKLRSDSLDPKHGHSKAQESLNTTVNEPACVVIHSEA